MNGEGLHMMMSNINKLNAIKILFLLGFVGVFTLTMSVMSSGCVSLKVADYDNTKKYGIEGNSYGLHPVIFNGLYEKDSNFIVCLSNENYNNNSSPIIKVTINKRIIYEGDICPHKGVDWYLLGIKVAPKKVHTLRITGYFDKYQWDVTHSLSVDKSGFAQVLYVLDETAKMPGKITVMSMEGDPYFY